MLWARVAVLVAMPVVFTTGCGERSSTERAARQAGAEGSTSAAETAEDTAVERTLREVYRSIAAGTPRLVHVTVERDGERAVDVRCSPRAIETLLRAEPDPDRAVECDARGVRCVAGEGEERAGGRAPAVLLSFSRPGTLETVVHFRGERPPSVSASELARARDAACAFHDGLLSHDAVEVPRLGMFEHRFADPTGEATHDRERHACGVAATEIARGILATQARFGGWDACAAEPLSCSVQGGGEDLMTVYGRREDARVTVHAIAITALEPLMDPELVTTQRADVGAFLVRAAELPVPRRFGAWPLFVPEELRRTTDDCPEPGP